MTTRMKPRLRRRFGIWACTTFWPFVCGCGYTPREAYSEWQGQHLPAERKQTDEIASPAQAQGEQSAEFPREPHASAATT